MYHHRLFVSEGAGPPRLRHRCCTVFDARAAAVVITRTVT